MLKVHGRATSSNVQAVMWAVGEMNIAHERLDVGGEFGGNQDPAFLAMNPMGRVPVIQDGAVTLFESQAILRYLGAAYGKRPFWPVDPEHRAVVDQWMEWTKVNVLPVLIYKVFWQLVRVAATERDTDLVAQGCDELKPLMKIADDRIARFGWLAGPEMTMADISFGTGLFRYFTVDFEKAELPNLATYYDKLCARPAYAEHVMVSFESLRVPGA